MSDVTCSKNVSPARLAIVAVLLTLLFAVGGCRTKSKVTVPQRLTPVVEAETNQLLEEINRLSQVRSIRGKIDVQFLDTSFAECGVAEQYRTAEGSVTVQRPGKIYLAIQAPFGIKIAEMTSDGEHFRVAVLQGSERIKRFVMGTNSAEYQRLDADGEAGAPPRCEDDKRAMEGGNGKGVPTRTISALSGLRPQHFTDALLVNPVSPEGSNLIYTQAEAFEEEPDARKGAKKGARVVRTYYLLDEIAPEGAGRGRLLRRFWFDRVAGVRLSRIQSYDARGQLVTDVVYRDPQRFGEEGRYLLPATIELTRPQDRYSLRVAFQSPETVTLDRPWPETTFALQNSSNLPVKDLDAPKK